MVLSTVYNVNKVTSTNFKVLQFFSTIFKVLKARITAYNVLDIPSQYVKIVHELQNDQTKRQTM